VRPFRTGSVQFVLAAKPQAVSVSFVKGKSVLSVNAKHALAALSKRLIAGARLSVTGYAHGNTKLARSRTITVANYTVSKLKLTVSIKTVTTSTSNSATVVTTQQ
jgi:hypothetical protein